MRIRLVVVGIGHWSDFTLPFITGLQMHNPEQVITLVDNASDNPYPPLPGVEIVRLEKRVGYGSAINAGAAGDWDWLICCNNDCECSGNITEIVPLLSDNTIYGAGPNEWYADMVESGYLYIPRRIWEAVGPFDPEMDAAFEDFDYMLRALRSGFRVTSVSVPMKHLYAHTRYEEAAYQAKWDAVRERFFTKHPEGLRRKA